MKKHAEGVITIEEFASHPYFKRGRDLLVLTDTLPKPGRTILFKMYGNIEGAPEFPKDREFTYRFIGNVALPEVYNRNHHIDKLWQNLDFSQALALLKEGCYMTRTAFGAQGIHHIYVLAKSGAECSDPETYEIRTAIYTGNAGIKWMPSGNRWEPTNADFFATDWRIFLDN